MKILQHAQGKRRVTFLLVFALVMGSVFGATWAKQTGFAAQDRKIQEGDIGFSDAQSGVGTDAVSGTPGSGKLPLTGGESVLKNVTGLGFPLLDTAGTVDDFVLPGSFDYTVTADGQLEAIVDNLIATNDVAEKKILIENNITLNKTINIHFDGGMLPGTRKEIVNLKLYGKAKDVTIFSNGADYHFEYFNNTTNSSNLELYNLTMDGNGAGGGIITQLNTAYFENVTFQNHRNRALHVNTRGTTVIKNCEFLHNESANVNGVALGTRNSEVTVENSKFQYNKATNTAANLSGGTIIFEGSTVRMLDCSITDNESGSTGAGIYLTMGSNTSRFENCVIANNRSARRGAGMHIAGSNIVNITDSTIHDNVMTGSDNGAGMYIDGSAKVSIEDTQITDNTGASQGGGIYQTTSSSGHIKLKDVTFKGNQAGKGGGLYLNSIATTSPLALSPAEISVIDDCIFEENSATDGAGLYIVSGTGTSTQQTEVKVTGDTIIKKNIASGNGGGAFLQPVNANDKILIENTKFVENDAGGSGGGIYSLQGRESTAMTNAGLLRLDGITVSDNTAKSEGGGLYHQHAAYGQNGRMEIENSTLIGNSGTMGGAVYAVPQNSFTLTLTGNVIENNFSNGKLSGLGLTGTTNNGGGLYLSANTISLEDNLIKNNETSGSVNSGSSTNSGNGGGLFLTGSATVQMKNNTFEHNTAKTHGGGLFAANGTLVSDGTMDKFTQNKAKNGGGVYLSSTASLDLQGSTTVSQNTAESHGGGIYTANAAYTNLKARDIAFLGNKASVYYKLGNAALQATHDGNITHTSLSNTETNYAYNNYDINLSSGDAIYYYDVKYHDPSSANVTYTDAVSGDVAAFSYTILGEAGTGMTRAGYYIEKWTTAADGTGTAYTPGQAITLSSDMDLHAQWKLNTYTVTFDPNNGDPTFTDTVNHGVAVGQPLAPVRSGFEFDDWRVGTETGAVWNFSTSVTGDMILVAAWKAETTTTTTTTPTSTTTTTTPTSTTTTTPTNGTTTSNATTSTVAPTVAPEATTTRQTTSRPTTSAPTTNAPATRQVTTAQTAAPALAMAETTQETSESSTTGAVTTTATSTTERGLIEEDDEVTPLGRLLRSENWSLINLLLLLLTAGIAIYLVVQYAMGKKNSFRLLSLVPAIGAMVMFFLTQDLGMPMIAMDGWTWVFAALLIVQGGCWYLSRRGKEDGMEEK